MIYSYKQEIIWHSINSTSEYSVLQMNFPDLPKKIICLRLRLLNWSRTALPCELNPASTTYV